MITLTQAVMNQVVINEYNNYNEAMEHLDQQGVVHLGWLNAGIHIPKHLNCQKVYSNRSGSSCLYCDPIYRISYSVDMGD
jgi:hypothetical protein